VHHPQRHAVDANQVARRSAPVGAFVQGSLAAKRGAAIEACPYADGPDAIAWRNGWRYARGEGTQAEDLAAAFAAAPPPPPKRRRRTPPRDRESTVVRECLSCLRQLGALVCRTNTGRLQLGSGNWMSTGTPGWPDITGMLPGGRFIGVECKARTSGRLSAEQQRIAQQIRRRGGVYIVARSAGDVVEGVRHATGR